MVATSDASTFTYGIVGIVVGTITTCYILSLSSVMHFIDSFPIPINGFIVFGIMMTSIIVNIGIAVAIGSCIYEIQQRRYVEIVDPPVRQRESEYLQILSYQ